jgi:Phosphoserine phosphatase RsbU, N-terminal domain
VLTMTDPVSRLRLDYAPAFLAYLARRDEVGLHSAYELGRAAMANGVRMLDLVQVHHVVLLDVLTTAKSKEELHDLGQAAAAFLVEALATFEMAQRDLSPKSPARKERRGRR